MLVFRDNIPIKQCHTTKTLTNCIKWNASRRFLHQIYITSKSLHAEGLLRCQALGHSCENVHLFIKSEQTHYSIDRFL